MKPLLQVGAERSEAQRFRPAGLALGAATSDAVAMIGFLPDQAPDQPNLQRQ